MLTDFQQAKLIFRFGQLAVADDGYIQQGDLETLAERLCDRLIPAAMPAERSEVHEGYQALWRHLAATADTDGDNRVSRAEYLDAVGRGVVDDPQQYENSIDRIVTALFRALDIDGNGHLDLAELQRMGAAFGHSEQDIVTLFGMLDTDGNGVISVDELTAAVRDFYYGDDPDSAGSYIFGKIS